MCEGVKFFLTLLERYQLRGNCFTGILSITVVFSVATDALATVLNTHQSTQIGSGEEMIIFL